MRLEHLSYIEFGHNLDTPLDIKTPTIKDYWNVYKHYPWKLLESVFNVGIRLLRNLFTLLFPYILSALVIKYGLKLILQGLAKVNEQYPLAWIDWFIEYGATIATLILIVAWGTIFLYMVIKCLVTVDEDIRGLLYKDIWTPPVLIFWERNRSGFIPHVYEYSMYGIAISNKKSWEKYHGLSYENRFIQDIISMPSTRVSVGIRDFSGDANFLEMFIVETRRHNRLSETPERLNVITEDTDFGVISWDLGNGQDWQRKKRRLKAGINR